MGVMILRSLLEIITPTTSWSRLQGRLGSLCCRRCHLLQLLCKWLSRSKQIQCHGVLPLVRVAQCKRLKVLNNFCKVMYGLYPKWPASASEGGCRGHSIYLNFCVDAFGDAETRRMLTSTKLGSEVV
jgi:hypothetical protein